MTPVRSDSRATSPPAACSCRRATWATPAGRAVRALPADRPGAVGEPLRARAGAGCAGQGAGAGPAVAGRAGDPVFPRGGRRAGDSVPRSHRASGCAPAGGRQAALPAGHAGRRARAAKPCWRGWSRAPAIADLVPLHRLDRLTAGLVLFSTRPGHAVTPTSACSASGASTRPTRRWRRRCPGWRFRWSGTAGWCRANRSSAWTKRRASRMRGPRIEVHRRRRPDLALPAAARVPAASTSCACTWPRWARRSWATTCIRSCARRAPGEVAAPLQLLAQALAFVDPLSGEPRQFAATGSSSHVRPRVVPAAGRLPWNRVPEEPASGRHYQGDWHFLGAGQRPALPGAFGFPGSRPAAGIHRGDAGISGSRPAAALHGSAP